MFSPRRPADIESGIVLRGSSLEFVVLLNNLASLDTALLTEREEEEEDCVGCVGSDVVSGVPGVTFTVFPAVAVVWTWSCPRC